MVTPRPYNPPPMRRVPQLEKRHRTAFEGWTERDILLFNTMETHYVKKTLDSHEKRLSGVEKIAANALDLAKANKYKVAAVLLLITGFIAYGIFGG